MTMIDPIKHYRVLLKQNLKHLGLQINSQNHRHNSKFTLQKLVNKQTTRPIKSKTQLNKNGNKPTHKYTNLSVAKTVVHTYPGDFRYSDWMSAMCKQRLIYG